MEHIRLYGVLPDGFSQRRKDMEILLGVAFSEDGIPVHVCHGEALAVKKSAQGIHLTWNKPVQFYRGLSHLKQHWDSSAFSIEETPCFSTGVMLDCSRNAVILPSAMETTLCRMALMGMDLAMLYTEDTYEVPGLPYFGYMRGRYSQEELRALDDYAFSLGIELIPCIQTLGHLGRALRWPAMQQYSDVAEVLLTDDEKTMAVLEQMITAASRPFRSRRIHIGMDEAHGVGLGQHLRLHGYESPHGIIHRHLLRVKEITDRLGLTPIMWSDMFFRPDSPDGEYYDTDPSEAAVSSVVPDVQLMYWDYSHEDPASYAAMLSRHQKLTHGDMRRVCFAGAIWNWCGPAPAYEKTYATAKAALPACKAAGVDLVLATAWGDNGTECSRAAVLPGILLYAEYAYTGCLDKDALRDRFRVCCQGDLDQFLGLSAFNAMPGMRPCWHRPVNAAKFLLYQDPLIQLFTRDMNGYDLVSHYRQLAERYAGYAAQPGAYQLHMQFYALLARILAEKCTWHRDIQRCVQNADTAGARTLCQLIPNLTEDLEALRLIWEQLWMQDNKPFGFEILDGRMGAMKSRWDTAQRRVLAWCADPDAAPLPELQEEVLPCSYGSLEEDRQCGAYSMGEILSACKLDL